MEFIKKFYTSKAGKRSLWTFLNNIMALCVAFLAFGASENMPFAISVLPFAQSASQFLTKSLNTKNNDNGSTS